MEQQTLKDLRNIARALRQEGKSIKEIMHELGIAKSTVSGWVRDIVLTQTQIERLKEKQRQYAGRSKGAQTNRQKGADRRKLYQQQGRFRAREASSPLHLAGCMLYWAEGSKQRNAIYFVNSDPFMMQFFVRFLREEYQVADEVCRVHIHCHSDDLQEMRRIEHYWLDLLQLPESCLMKTQVKKGSDTRKNILVNGVCGIRIQSTELTHHIYGAIQEYGGFENPAWLF
jgi:transposase-like protein